MMTLDHVSEELNQVHIQADDNSAGREILIHMLILDHYLKEREWGALYN